MIGEEKYVDNKNYTDGDLIEDGNCFDNNKDDDFDDKDIPNFKDNHEGKNMMVAMMTTEMRL